MANEPLILVPGVLCGKDLCRDQVPVLSTRADLGTTLVLFATVSRWPNV